MCNDMNIKKALKISFIIHFFLDIVFALPLMIMPVRFLSLLGWNAVDPIAARIASAALFGIGIESLLARNADLSSFRHMLRLKIIWSASALTGLIISAVKGYFSIPAITALLIGIFAVFNFVWTLFFILITKKTTADN
jgi:hypothetical protein